MRKGNYLLVFGLIGSCFSSHLFVHAYDFFATTFGYLLVNLSFSLLTLSALSEHSFLTKIRIPGTQTIALWSFAFYLGHKQLIYLTDHLLISLGLDHSSWISLLVTLPVCFSGAGLLYFCIEKPFLWLRDKMNIYPDLEMKQVATQG